MKYVFSLFFLLIQVFNQCNAAELVFLCNKVSLINSKGNYGIAPDKFSTHIKLNQAGEHKYKSTVLLGSKKYYIVVEADDHNYYGTSLENSTASVSSLIIDRSNGDSWLGFGNMDYSYVMYAKCKKREF